MRHREVNVQFTDEELLVFPHANVGIAVATERGLVVPVVHGAEHLSLAEVASARADIVGRAREGGLRQEDLEGGTFTISNLGMFGLDQFTAVLNPPQAAILAVGASQERPVVRRWPDRCPSDDDDDAHLRPPRRRRSARGGVPRDGEGDARRPLSGAVSAGPTATRLALWTRRSACRGAARTAAHAADGSARRLHAGPAPPCRPRGRLACVREARGRRADCRLAPRRAPGLRECQRLVSSGPARLRRRKSFASARARGPERGALAAAVVVWIRRGRLASPRRAARDAVAAWPLADRSRRSPVRRLGRGRGGPAAVSLARPVRRVLARAQPRGVARGRRGSASSPATLRSTSTCGATTSACAGNARCSLTGTTHALATPMSISPPGCRASEWRAVLRPGSCFPDSPVSPPGWLASSPRARACRHRRQPTRPCARSSSRSSRWRSPGLRASWACLHPSRSGNRGRRAARPVSTGRARGRRGPSSSSWKRMSKPSSWKKRIASTLRPTGRTWIVRAPPSRAAEMTLSASSRPIPSPRCASETTTGSSSDGSGMSPASPTTRPSASATQMFASPTFARCSSKARPGSSPPISGLSKMSRCRWVSSTQSSRHASRSRGS